MNMADDRLSNYIEVKDRVAEFFKRYPEGSIQTEIFSLTDKMVVVKAYAYRNAEDQKPGVDYSSLEIPGKTGFTRGSELENAATSAVGRALSLGLGIAAHRGIASKEEVAVKQAQSESSGSTAKLATDAMKRMVFAEAKKQGLGEEQIKALFALVAGSPSSDGLTYQHVDVILEELKTKGTRFQLASDTSKVG
jgi:hypothetical protein